MNFGSVSWRVGILFKGDAKALSFFYFRSCFVFLLFIGFFSGYPVYGEQIRTQTLQLEEGWNAVYLMVEPLSSDPVDVFGNSPVDVVAVYDGVFSMAQFSTDPAADLLSGLGWRVWYAPERPDSFLTELGAIYSQRGYLIHSTTGCVLNVEGEVEMPMVLWQPNAYNLVGFSLDPLAPPSFLQFFSSSKAHNGFSIYRLCNGIWQRVMDPENEAMRNGEAFWIYCEGSSNYQGPLNVSMMGGEGVVLAGGDDEILLENETDHPLVSTVEHVVSGESDIPLSIVVNVLDDDQTGVRSVRVPMGAGPWATTLPVLEAGAKVRLPLAARTVDLDEPEVRTLLCIKTDMGTETWLPVLGLRGDAE